jgi:predicted DCC family thiol-disulfide oxidoreductase YuxK
MTTTPILLFDGDCRSCTQCARWFERHARIPAAVVPWQRLDLAEFGLTPTDTRAAAWWIDANGGRHRGHRAVGHALLACGIRWQLVGWLCLTPPSSLAASLIYRVIARYRDRLPGGTPLCRTDAHRSDRP